LLELKSEAASVVGAAVGEDAEVGAFDFDPRVLGCMERADDAGAECERQDEYG
jgi:hypothetical protein